MKINVFLTDLKGHILFEEQNANRSEGVWEEVECSLLDYNVLPIYYNLNSFNYIAFLIGISTILISILWNKKFKKITL